jgi:hypothetical protein
MGNKVIDWLLSGDIAVQYQTRRDLLDDDRPALQNRAGGTLCCARLTIFRPQALRLIRV